MAITFGGQSTGSTTDSTSTTVTIPESAVADDVLLLHISAGRTTVAPTVSDDDTGGNSWQLLAETDQGTVYGGVYWKRATSGSASKTVTVTGDGGDPPDAITARVTLYRGCATSGTPFENAAATGCPSGTETVTGFTTSRDGAMVCLTNAISNNVAVSSQQTATSPGALTERFDYGNSSGSDIEIAHASAEQATAGATGDFTWAQSNANSVAIVWALLPPASGPITETPTPGGATSGGVGPWAIATGTTGGALAGGATAGGVAPDPYVTVTVGGGTGGGNGASAVVGVSPGGAIAGGLAPTDGSSTNETPTPGGAIAGGNAPSARAALISGGSSATGLSPSPHAPLVAGGGASGGTPPAAITITGMGGATAAGNSPSAQMSIAAPGGGAASGIGPDRALAAVSPGGARANGRTPSEVGNTVLAWIRLTVSTAAAAEISLTTSASAAASVDTAARALLTVEASGR